MPATPGNTIRWRPLAAILILAAAAVTANWLYNTPTIESKIFLTVAILIFLIVLVIIWLLLLSGIKWKQRLLFSGILLLLSAAVLSQLQIRGLSGRTAMVGREAERAGGGKIRSLEFSTASGPDSLSLNAS